MPKYEYDFLNALTYVGVLFFVFIYNQFCSKVQAWIMVEVSLVLILIMTLLMLANATRMNTESWGMSDEALNGIIFFLGTAAVSVLAYLAIQVLLTYLVPHNVEASVMALVSGTIVWSYEVGAKISASVYCLIFDVDDDHMENYPRVLTAKIPFIILVMLIAPYLIPENQKILRLAAKLRYEHSKKQSLQRQLDTKKLRQSVSNDEAMAEGGAISSARGVILAAQKQVKGLLSREESILESFDQDQMHDDDVIEEDQQQLLVEEVERRRSRMEQAAANDDANGLADPQDQANQSSLDLTKSDERPR
jgi:hypothetical protein